MRHLPFRRASSVTAAVVVAAAAAVTGSTAKAPPATSSAPPPAHAAALTVHPGPCPAGQETLSPGLCAAPPAKEKAAKPVLTTAHPVAAYEYGEPVSTAPRAVPCTSPGTSGNRIQALYVYLSGQTSRLTTVKPIIQDALLRANGIVYSSAAQTGGSRDLRYATDSACQPSVLAVQLSTTTAPTFPDMVTALRALGYKGDDRKYIAFVESRNLCGVAYLSADDRPDSQNANNKGNTHARLDLGCWSGNAAAHEITHMLGAVQDSAGRSDKAGHCLDEKDTMCYDSASGTGTVYTSASCQDAILEERLDCNKNDYFNTNPAAGSYLDTKWNVARSAYLWNGGPAYVFKPNPVTSLTAAPATCLVRQRAQVKDPFPVTDYWEWVEVPSVKVDWVAPATDSNNSAASYYTVKRIGGPYDAVVSYNFDAPTTEWNDCQPLSGTATYQVTPQNVGGAGPTSSIAITR